MGKEGEKEEEGRGEGVMGGGGGETIERAVAACVPLIPGVICSQSSVGVHIPASSSPRRQ